MAAARAVPAEDVTRSQVEFVSDDQLESALLSTDLPPEQIDEIVDQNAESRIIALQISLAVLALLGLLALLSANRLPDAQPDSR